MQDLTIGIVGATGLVGQTVCELLTEGFSSFSVKNVKVYASRASVGKTLAVCGQKTAVQEPRFSSLMECDVVVFATHDPLAQELIPQLAEGGVLCVDKSSAFRDHPLVPLVVPEVNGHLLSAHHLAAFPVVASPNCCTIPLVMILKPLQQHFGVSRVVVSTYQSVSGAGGLALETLTQETQDFYVSQDLSCKKSVVFPKSIAFNVFPFVSHFLENGDTDEEAKIMAETQKILVDMQLPLAVTSVRVPTFVGHGQAVTLELKKSFSSVTEVIQVLSAAEGVSVSDHTTSSLNEFPFITPREAHGKNEVFVSRVRPAKVFQSGLSVWIVSDNLRKGAALNALQIVNMCALNGVLQVLKNRRRQL
jgi:aspartate-semialdehyde dehydrogenase